LIEWIYVAQLSFINNYALCLYFTANFHPKSAAAVTL